MNNTNVFDYKEINQLLPGDIVLVENIGVLPNIIKWFMDLDRRRRGLPERRLWSHAGIIVDLWGNKYIAEAESKGIQVTPFVKRYLSKRNLVKVITPKKPYVKSEQAKLNKIAVESALEPTRYDFLGLLGQVKYSLTGKWPGKKGKKAEKRMYCTEAVATWANKIRPNTFTEPASTNPLDLDLNKYYKDKVFE